MALIILDRQHVGKPGKDETGAWGDFDLDGNDDVTEAEAILTAMYGLWIEIRLRELGHRVIVVSDGRYADRHKRVNSYKADAYLALHLNAGGGNYSLVLHDARSKAGPALGEAISASLAKLLPKLKHRVAPTGPKSDFPRGFPCIEGVFSGTAVAALLEPLFLDNADHQTFLKDPANMKALGIAIADGVHSWLSSR